MTVFITFEFSKNPNIKLIRVLFLDIRNIYFVDLFVSIFSITILLFDFAVLIE